MVNKSYQKGYNFQRRVLKHLTEKGFNCVVQPKSAFPDIVAWKPFVDSLGRSLAVNTQTEVGDKAYTSILIPYYVTLIECKVNKYLNKKEKDAAKKILEEGRCNNFFVAYKDKRKLKFEKIGITRKKEIIKEIKEIPSWIR